MTKQGPIRIDPDGTRHYKGTGTTYKPVPDEERKYKRHKPDHPLAVRFNGDWLLPLPLVIDSLRTMPDTRPDVLFITHRFLCQCRRCQVPGILRAKRRLHGLNWQGVPPAQDPLPADLFRFEGFPRPDPGSPSR